MNSWEVLAKAINEPGTKICYESWDVGYYMYYVHNVGFKDKDGESCDPAIYMGRWQLYKEPAKLVEWFRPKVVWFHCHKMPWHHSSAKFYKEKDIKLWADSECKVLEWETIMAPETYEECND